MKRVVFTAIVVVLAGQVGMARAADKPDPNGTWKWTVEMNGQKRDVTLKLKLEKDKLTGTMPGRNNQETAIEDGTFKDGEISFSVTRDRMGTKVTTKYTGKIDGDTLKGKMEFERNGEKMTREFEAKRSKD
jgi:hypothetical protein